MVCRKQTRKFQKIKSKRKKTLTFNNKESIKN